MLGPPKAQDDTPTLQPQPLVATSSRSSKAKPVGGTSSSIEDGSSSSGAADQPATKSFDQPGLQYELGWNLQHNSPVLSATRRFGGTSDGSSSHWSLKQVRAAFDGKSSALSLSAAGGCWNFGMMFPTEATGPLGLPKLGQAGLWPKVLLTLTPDLTL